MSSWPSGELGPAVHAPGLGIPRFTLIPKRILGDGFAHFASRASAWMSNGVLRAVPFPEDPAFESLFEVLGGDEVAVRGSDGSCVDWGLAIHPRGRCRMSTGRRPGVRSLFGSGASAVITGCQLLFLAAFGLVGLVVFWQAFVLRLVREGWKEGIWVGLLPLLFTAVAAAGIWAIFWFHRVEARTEAEFAGSPAFPAAPEAVSGALKPVESRWSRTGSTLGMALFWNSMVLFFLIADVAILVEGEKVAMGIFMAIFLVPFVLVGLFLIGNARRGIRGLRNPVPEITVGRAGLPLGEAVPFEWRFAGRTDRLTGLRITLEGTERATKREERVQGGRRSRTLLTEEKRFAELEVVAVDDAASIAGGAGRDPRPGGDGPVAEDEERGDRLAAEGHGRDPEEAARGGRVRGRGRPGRPRGRCVVIRLTLREGRTTFRPGEDVAGTVSWQGEAQAPARSPSGSSGRPTASALRRRKSWPRSGWRTCGPPRRERSASGCRTFPSASGGGSSRSFGESRRSPRARRKPQSLELEVSPSGHEILLCPETEAVPRDVAREPGGSRWEAARS